MQKQRINHAQTTDETRVEIALQGYAALIGSTQELAEAWDTMEAEEQVLQRAFVMAD
jgi:hypothetical protein